LSAAVLESYKHTQKFQVPAICRENVIQIFVKVNFYEANCTAAVQSKKVWYIESCLGREPKEIASIAVSTSSPRQPSFKRNYWQCCIFKERVSIAVFTSFSF
jgi:hypothetical protein